MNETRLLDLLIRLIDRGTQSQFNLLFHKYHEADSRCTGIINQ